MSIRLRFTLLYNAILALTLTIFGVALYSIQAQTTYDAIQRNVLRASDTISVAILRNASAPVGSGTQTPVGTPANQTHLPMPFQDFSNDQAFQTLREREVVRVLDPAGNLVASPFGRNEEALPLSETCMQTLIKQGVCWARGTALGEQMLIYNSPIISDGKVVYILQVARALTDRDNSLDVLGTTLVVASIITLLIAFGIGWVLSGVTISPIKRITQTARAIGDEHDLTQRVVYNGPQDEVGQLATTFNSMLTRLQDAYQQVARSLEMQRNFVADVSHELRTPLTTLRGNLGLLRRNPPIPADEQTDILSDMVDESDRLIRLVNDLLVLARADAGRNLSEEAVQVFPVLDETCRQARQLAPKRQITLADTDLSISADRDAFKQVLLIGLDNALKHSSGDILVSAEQKNSQVEICIRDFGKGIDPEKLGHIFERFYRDVESETSPGFGLGLPIAKALVEAMGGRIWMESQPGQGSKFLMQLQKA
jgi:signal transduction histidine kinase